MIEDLREMMIEMHYIIAHEVLERRRLICGDGAKRYLMEIVPRARPSAGVRRARFHHVREMEIEMRPQRTEIVPVSVDVFLSLDPRVLIVGRAHEIIRALRAHKTLVIIGRRIDEMPDDFLARPFARRARAPGFHVWNGFESRERRANCVAKCGFGCIHAVG